jgi:L-lactate utilization protein LutB
VSGPLCGARHEVCPATIDIPEVLVYLRARVTQESKEHGRHRVERAARA